MRIYFDTCCLNRPFDDQNQTRIRLESEAILLILDRIERTKGWKWLTGEVIEQEIGKTADLEKRKNVYSLENKAHHYIVLDESVEERGRHLVSLGFMTYDALHLASAEAGNADCFFTTDDRLLKQAKLRSTKLRVKVANPLLWLFEESKG